METDEERGVVKGLLRETGDPDAPYEALPMPPRPDQLVAISEGVLEGDHVEGVRYPSPEHMSGWYIFTDRYDGDIESMTLHHAHHITEARPDFAELLDLPHGCRFAPDEESGEYTWWYDDEVASEPIEEEE